MVSQATAQVQASNNLTHNHAHVGSPATPADVLNQAHMNGAGSGMQELQMDATSTEAAAATVVVATATVVAAQMGAGINLTHPQQQQQHGDAEDNKENILETAAANSTVRKIIFRD